MFDFGSGASCASTVTFGGSGFVSFRRCLKRAWAKKRWPVCPFQAVPETCLGEKEMRGSCPLPAGAVNMLLQKRDERDCSD